MTPPNEDFETALYIWWSLKFIGVLLLIVLIVVVVLKSSDYILHSELFQLLLAAIQDQG